MYIVYISECPFPQYVKTNIPGPGCDLEQFSEQYAGCDCEALCSVTFCNCFSYFGLSYNEERKLCVENLPTGFNKPIIECGNDCSCSMKCHNRVVQRGIRHTFSVFQSQGKGLGLMNSATNETIPAFSFVCEYAGEVIGYEEARRRVRENEAHSKDNYVIALREHVQDKETCFYVDPYKLGNLGRFINHSCDPNLIMIPVRINHPIPRLALFARRDITPGEELTFDYSGKATFLSSLKRSASCLPSNVKSEKSEFDKASSIEECHKSVSKICSNFEDIGASEAKYSCSNLDTDENITEPALKKSRVSESEIDAFKNDTLPSKQSISPTSANVQLINDDNNVSKGVKRKLCFCSSTNCQTFLPYDQKLLVDC